MCRLRVISLLFLKKWLLLANPFILQNNNENVHTCSWQCDKNNRIKERNSIENDSIVSRKISRGVTISRMTPFSGLSIKTCLCTQKVQSNLALRTAKIRTSLTLRTKSPITVFYVVNHHQDKSILVFQRLGIKSQYFTVLAQFYQTV